MKISFVEPHLKIFGGIRRIIELSNRLTKKGHDVTIFHSDGRECGWMKCIAKVKSYGEVLQESHDVIIYNDPNPVDYQLVKKADAKLKVFYVLELYNKELLKGLNFRIYHPRHERMLILKKSLRSHYLKLSNATWEKEWLQENMGIDSELVMGGVNLQMFHPISLDKKPGEIRILCSGDPRERKGTKTILEAFDLARKDEPTLILDTYHGKGIAQEKLAEKYCSADIFIEASWHAGWNNPVVEAMAFKKPLIGGNRGGVIEVIEDSKNGYLVDPDDPKAVAAALCRILKNKNLAESLGKRGRRKVESEFYIKCMAQKTLELL